MIPIFNCLDFVFSLHATDPALQRIVEDLYAPFTSDDEPTVHYSIINWVGQDPCWIVHAGTEELRTTSDPTIALAHLVWEISQRVMKRPTTSVQLHAAAAELDGLAVLLPAPSGRGKSTLVAGLVASGLRYLTDDLAPIESATGLVVPYPKPISLARRLWALFPKIPQVSGAQERYFGDDGFITAGALGGVLGNKSAPRLVVAPHYTPGAAVRLNEVSRAESMILLTEQSFNANALGRSALTLLSAVLRDCLCFRLEYGDLNRAVEVIREQLAAVSVAGSR